VRFIVFAFDVEVTNTSPAWIRFHSYHVFRRHNHPFAVEIVWVVGWIIRWRNSSRCRSKGGIPSTSL